MIKKLAFISLLAVCSQTMDAQNLKQLRKTAEEMITNAIEFIRIPVPSEQDFFSQTQQIGSDTVRIQKNFFYDEPNWNAVPDSEPALQELIRDLSEQFPRVEEIYLKREKEYTPDEINDLNIRITRFIPMLDYISLLGYVHKNGTYRAINQMSEEVAWDYWELHRPGIDSVRLLLRLEHPGSIARMVLNDSNNRDSIDHVTLLREQIAPHQVRLTLENSRHDFTGVTAGKLIAVVSTDTTGRKSEYNGLTKIFYPVPTSYANYIDGVIRQLEEMREAIKRTQTSEEMEKIMEACTYLLTHTTLNYSDDKIVYEFDNSSGLIEVYYRTNPTPLEVIFTKAVIPEEMIEVFEL